MDTTVNSSSPGASAGTTVRSDENTWSMLCHLSAFSCFVVPFGNIIGPLVIWLLKRDQYPAVNDQGKESLNFQISFTIYFFISVGLTLLLIGIPLLIGLGIFFLVIVIVATVKASEGMLYRYPMNMRLVK